MVSNIAIDISHLFTRPTAKNSQLVNLGEWWKFIQSLWHFEKRWKTNLKINRWNPKNGWWVSMFLLFPSYRFFRNQGVNVLHDLGHKICHVLQPWSPAVGDIVAIVRHHVGSIPDFPSDALIVKLDHFPSSKGDFIKNLWKHHLDKQISICFLEFIKNHMFEICWNDGAHQDLSEGLDSANQQWIYSWGSDCYQLSVFDKYMWNLAHSQYSLYHQHPRGKTVRRMASCTVLNGQSLDHPIRKYTSAGWVSPTASRAVQQQAARWLAWWHWACARGLCQTRKDRRKCAFAKQYVHLNK